MSQWILHKEVKDIEYSLSEQIAQVKINTTKYTAVRLYNDIGEVASGYNYDFKINIESNSQIKIFYIFYDENQQEYCKGYLKNIDTVMVPEGAVTGKIEVLILSDKFGKTIISGLEFKKTDRTPKRKVKIVSIPYGNYGMELKRVEENYLNIAKDIDNAALYNPDIMVLTECVFHTRILPEDYSIINTLDDKYVSLLKEKAKEYNTYIVASIRMRDDNDNLRNAGILIDRNGEIKGVHYKSHLTIGEYEEGMLPGDEIDVYETDFGKVAILICWEHFFPEAVRLAMLKGAEILLVPTHGFKKERIQTRANESGCYAVTSQYKDGTVIVNPLGEIIGDCSDSQYAVSEIDLNSHLFVPWLSCNSNALPNNIYINERRKEIYNMLTE